jgi:hypothetical protein
VPTAFYRRTATRLRLNVSRFEPGQTGHIPTRDPPSPRPRRSSHMPNRPSVPLLHDLPPDFLHGVISRCTAGELARRSAARCSAPEINGPVVQPEFTFLLRETCRPNPSTTVGAVARNGCRAGTGVSRGRSTEGNEPGDGSTGRTHDSGRAELGRQTRPSLVLFRSAEADGLSYRAAIKVAEKECCVIPQGLSGTAVRGPACTVVWELGGAIPPATRLNCLGAVVIRR